MERSKSSAVFSPDDFNVLRKAVRLYYLEYNNNLPKEELRKLASLMHRLNRINYDE